MKQAINEIQPFLNKLALYYTKDSTDAQDLVQETLLKAISKSHQFENNTNYRAWVATIMKNSFINTYRKKKRRNQIGLEPYRLNASVQVENEGEFNFFQMELEEMMKHLNRDQQRALLLRKEGYSYKEIAEELRRPLGSIKSLIHKARSILKNRYQLQMQS